MKFLLSGSLFQKRGPRTLLLMTILLLAAGMVAHAARYSLDWSERYDAHIELRSTDSGVETVELDQDEMSDYSVGKADDEPGLLNQISAGLHEDLHVDLFLFAILYLALASVWLQAPDALKQKKFFQHAPPIALLLFVAIRYLSFLFQLPSILEALVATVFYTVYMLDFGCLLFLLLKPKASNGKGQG